MPHWWEPMGNQLVSQLASQHHHHKTIIQSPLSNIHENLENNENIDFFNTEKSLLEIYINYKNLNLNDLPKNDFDLLDPNTLNFIHYLIDTEKTDLVCDILDFSYENENVSQELRNVKILLKSIIFRKNCKFEEIGVLFLLCVSLLAHLWLTSGKLLAHFRSSGLEVCRKWAGSETDLEPETTPLYV